ncbi:MAG: peptidase M28 [Novosphingobium sp. 28-62-57]|uniref:M28 family metallopeptidase n=1 Tax=unclassified Novosphingobium TaxID=2644732 RepID=UPI000BD629DB|nr:MULTISPECIES: M28 family metallopeptidase [unclassified Novosphingobium]OYW48259.1 MAG: peptidase M28 [Novosphingobium sp. 12-62-10]OYZ10255.1 MAG: peptidase M28 [Novosphingobium sp. 28-62-57]OZA35094.1 MAG: peptidase M28 [Novosphingobium sp. 17-62-9]HQS71107.1 M28 family metallopeptidase [Novosphingobium sp.]
MNVKTLLIATLMVSTAAPALAQDPVFNPEAVRAHVTFLADDLLEGRDTGTRGYDIAANYVASQFITMGLKPAGPDGSFFQKLTVREARLDGTPKLTLTYGGKETVLADTAQVLVRPSLSDKAVAAQAPLVFAGFGFDRPDLGFDDYKGLNVKGKIVVLLTGFPKGTPSELGAHLNSEKAVMAMKRGAVGVIYVPTIEDSARRPWARRVEISDGPAKGWVGADGTAFSRTGAIKGSATLNPDAATPLFAAAGKPLAKVLAEANKTGGRPKGFDLKAKASLTFANMWKDVTSANVVAMLPGTDPQVAGEFVGMTAHLDHIGDHGKAADKLFNGAMDNASGVATMLEVARAVVQDRPRRPVMFAALTGEEGGLIGSDYLARNPLVKGDIVGLVNFDMPVLTYTFSDVVAFGAENSTMGPVVAEAARKAGIKLSPDPMPEEGLFTRSDHYRFVQQGVPAVFMMTGFEGPGEKAFRDFLKTHYHQPSDDLKLPFNWEAGALFAKVNYYTVMGLANGAERPRWYAGSFFGKEFAPAAAKAADPAK